MKTITKTLLIASLGLSALLAACSPAPGSSPSLPAVSIPPVSVDPSAASAAVVAALDQLGTEIDANQSETGLTTEDTEALKGFVAQIRTAVQSGDMSAAQPAIDQLSAKVAELDAKLGTDAGARLKAALTQLEALVAAS
jgi:hypothetical protein